MKLFRLLNFLEGLDGQGWFMPWTEGLLKEEKGGRGWREGALGKEEGGMGRSGMHARGTTYELVTSNVSSVQAKYGSRTTAV